MDALTPRQARARLAAAQRHHPTRDHTALRRELVYAHAVQLIRRLQGADPSLTNEQRRALACQLLTPGVMR